MRTPLIGARGDHPLRRDRDRAGRVVQQPVANPAELEAEVFPPAARSDDGGAGSNRAFQQLMQEQGAVPAARFAHLVDAHGHVL
ncbi:hypothetical protein [Streptomyces sp. NBC_01613]|uniref:hypothetical protein n=1 Tax=Streptomyces sp. NBC_01613 TaxID=2975896 RepID=UPI003863A770